MFRYTVQETSCQIYAKRRQDVPVAKRTASLCNPTYHLRFMGCESVTARGVEELYGKVGTLLCDKALDKMVFMLQSKIHCVHRFEFADEVTYWGFTTMMHLSLVREEEAGFCRDSKVVVGVHLSLPDNTVWNAMKLISTNIALCSLEPSAI